MRIEIPCNACIVDQEIDISMPRFHSFDHGKKTGPICDVTFNCEDLVEFLHRNIISSTTSISLMEYMKTARQANIENWIGS